MPESYWHISHSNFFSQIAPDDIRQLEQASKIRKFKRGEAIYLPADDADGVMLLTSGRVKLCHLTHEGKQSIFVFVEPGEIFGELSVVDCGKREEYAEAVENSQIVLIPCEKVQWVMAKYPHISLGITKLIGFRRRRIERRLKNLLFRSNRERLIYLILELVEQYGVATEQGVELKIKLSHQDLANIIGSTRETVTVVLGQLQSEGFLQIARRRLTVTNAEGLSSQVDEPVNLQPVQTDAPKRPPTLAVF
ncbi:MAG TPA: Crp/Fnr family transcriptional regulator [Pirellulaceae bacterium]|nr:Crp/Fnr family transcriptional regulator [Pirellulaceae bacterium]HMO92851.1 Crp/Fnr family transcriptional regulator [Pirellulaceae bacterium]HMP69407.1 Crp/Fnr family transcriptional regulator [Pirellulaceae bacterium]